MKKVMLEMLFEEMPQELEKMKTLASSQSWQDLGSVSHKMKSTLSFIGNDDMTNANKQIETIAKNEENTQKIPQLIHSLHELYPKALAELQQEHGRI